MPICVPYNFFCIILDLTESSFFAATFEETSSTSDETDSPIFPTFSSDPTSILTPTVSTPTVSTSTLINYSTSPSVLTSSTHSSAPSTLLNLSTDSSATTSVTTSVFTTTVKVRTY